MTMAVRSVLVIFESDLILEEPGQVLARCRGEITSDGKSPAFRYPRHTPSQKTIIPVTIQFRLDHLFLPISYIASQSVGHQILLGHRASVYGQFLILPIAGALTTGY